MLSLRDHRSRVPKTNLNTRAGGSKAGWGVVGGVIMWV